MKRQLLFLLTIFSFQFSFSQDTLITRSNDTILHFDTENSSSKIKYPIVYTGQQIWKRNGAFYSESDLHSFLGTSKNLLVLKPLGKAKITKNLQYIGLGNILIGIAGIACYRKAEALSNSPNYSIRGIHNYENASLTCAILAVNLNIYGVIMYHIHKNETRKAVNAYNASLE